MVIKTRKTVLVKVKASSGFSDVTLCRSAPAAAKSRIKLRAPEAETAQQFAHKTAQKMGKIYQVVVHGLRGEKMTIDLCNTEEQMKSMTVEQLKEKILQRLPGEAGQDNVRLVFTDKQLDGDSSLLTEYGVQHMSVIHMVLKVPGGLMA
uniref:Ubiquitin-like domain-containing protein n=2 Tax=Amphiprion TaxID=80969 RepID=A0AAQ5ZDT1_AMPOC